MDATAAKALCIAMGSAVPPALEENERLRAKLLLTQQRYLAFVKAECDKCNAITNLISEALDRVVPGADNQRILWELIGGILRASPPIAIRDWQL
jgi:hypothetical protein